MFADPQSVTIASVANSLPSVGRNTDYSIYKKDDDSLKLTISHQYGKRKRFTVRLDAQKVAADPLSSANNQLYSSSAYLVMDCPLVGYSNSEIRDIASALSAWCTSANLLKVLGGET